MNDDKKKKKSHILNRDKNTITASCPLCREDGTIQKGDSLNHWVNEEHKEGMKDAIEEVKKDVKECVYVRPGHTI